MSDRASNPSFDTTAYGQQVIQAAEELLRSGQAQELSVLLHGGTRHDWVHAVRRPEDRTYVVELLSGGPASSNPASPGKIVIVPLWLISHIAGMQVAK